MTLAQPVCPTSASDFTYVPLEEQLRTSFKDIVQVIQEINIFLFFENMAVTNKSIYFPFSHAVESKYRYRKSIQKNDFVYSGSP